MLQDLEVIDCNITELQSEPFTENTTANTEIYTAKQLASILSVSERSIYGYANRLLEAWHWLPESEFRANGIYTSKALFEMRRLKEIGNASEYAQQVARENQKPQQATIKATAAIAPARQTEALETKLASIQRNTTALNISVQDRIATIKERIATEASRTRNNQSVLDELEAQQAIAGVLVIAPPQSFWLVIQGRNRLGSLPVPEIADIFLQRSCLV